ncbi:hypothetical protein PO25_11490 [Vibrio anguillarum]|uniref:hypothetical protein n=1 Tax=Vibrio anguillarum TaxID=55601 RepID=UPI001AD82D10|nr:hypothetical protein [Vibrio anguillarum]MBT2948510.1 hypothetical protein [Vibrio anguillarum]
MFYSDDINSKSFIVAISFIKYFVWLLVIMSSLDEINTKRFKTIFISSLSFCFFSQLAILIFQKFDILGFASGIPFNFVVKTYAIPNIYYTADDIDFLISTHMNFSFRPVGTFGSSTVTGLIMYTVGSLLFRFESKWIFKFFAYFSALICFSKIALLLAIVVDFIIPNIARFNIRRLVLTFVSMPIVGLGLYIGIDYLGVMHNLQGAIDGSDRGVTHRINVINYVFEMDFIEFFFGNLGKLPFEYFDSGTLLSIFRYGVVFYVLEYVALYFIFKCVSKSNLDSFVFILYIFFADLTFGSVFNPIFSSAIFFYILFSGIKHKKCEI